MLTDHLKPGCLTYMRVQEEFPDALPAFVTWVTARQAWCHAVAMVQARRDAADVSPPSARLNQLWRGAAAVATTQAAALAEAMQFLAQVLRHSGIDEPPDSWAQTRWRALELEDDETGEQAA